MRSSLLTASLALAAVFAVAAAQQQFQQQQPFTLASLHSHSHSHLDIRTAQNIELPLPYTAAINARVRSTESRIAAHSAQHPGPNGFTTLTHQHFPHLTVRIRQHSAGNPSSAADPVINPDAWCDPTVKSWTGYIDTIDGKSLWFQFFESRSNPDKDPLLLWTNGGPGCSSAVGLFQELGPCTVPLRNGAMPLGPPINATRWNPHSWNSQSSIIFIDQPVDVGYSYTRYGVHTYDADQGAKDLYAFLRIFFSAFPRFGPNEFVLTSESYGGRYAPRYAAEIVDRNANIIHKAARKGEDVDKSKLINLKSVAIGNGLTARSHQMGSYYDMTCSRKGGAKTPILSISACKRMETWKAKCEKILPEVCRDNFAFDDCAMHTSVCANELMGPYMATKRNPYNIDDDCKAGLSPNLCYDVSADIRHYLDRPDVRELIGAASVDQIGNFTTCDHHVGQGFAAAGDSLVDNVGYVSGLLERGIKVLIYVGTLDWICNWVGNKGWVFDMDWSGKDKFLSAENYGWRVDGELAGETQSAEGLTWATVLGAGHMVPYDKPVQAKNLIYRWLAGNAL
ncbi:hypothetical protein CF328_g8218 [Tilletia controversa]|nr:hypothetical protein CF328_g8218 [Tilletia controversa]